MDVLAVVPDTPSHRQLTVTLLLLMRRREPQQQFLNIFPSPLSWGTFLLPSLASLRRRRQEGRDGEQQAEAALAQKITGKAARGWGRRPTEQLSPSLWRLSSPALTPGPLCSLRPTCHSMAPPATLYHPCKTEVCPSLAWHHAASQGEENSKTLYGVKSCLDGRVGSWYAKAGRFRGKSCWAKPSPAKTLSGRHSNSRKEKKWRQRSSFKRAGKDYVGWWPHLSSTIQARLPATQKKGELIFYDMQGNSGKLLSKRTCILH